MYTSDNALIGYAEQSAEGVYVFTSPDQLKGVRVHPPFRVDASAAGDGLAANVAEALSGLLGR